MPKAPTPLAALKQAIEAALAVALTPHGFEHRPAAQLYEATAGDWTRIIHLNYADRKPVTSVAVDFAVRHREVERLTNHLRKDLGEAAKRQTATVGTPLGALVGRADLRFPFDDPADAGRRAETEVVPLIAQHGLPYLEAMCHLGALEARFASPRFRDWHQTAGGRAVRYPIVLALQGKTEDAARVLREVPAQLGPQDDFTADLYPRFAEFLTRTFDLPMRAD